MRTTDASKAIAAVEAAARACGMSYGRYVFHTGGLTVPPPEMVAQAQGSARRCRLCFRYFVPVQETQVYCSAYCRKADYDRRQKVEDKTVEH